MNKNKTTEIIYFSFITTYTYESPAGKKEGKGTLSQLLYFKPQSYYVYLEEYLLKIVPSQQIYT